MEADYRHHFRVSMESARNEMVIELKRQTMELEQQVKACHKRLTETNKELEQMKTAMGEIQNRMDAMREWARKKGGAESKESET